MSITAPILFDHKRPTVVIRAGTWLRCQPALEGASCRRKLPKRMLPQETGNYASGLYLQGALMWQETSSPWVSRRDTFKKILSQLLRESYLIQVKDNGNQRHDYFSITSIIVYFNGMDWKGVPIHPWHQPAVTLVNITRSCKYSQVLLMMGENIARNM